MRLPNSSRAIVDREEIFDYLLKLSHPENGGKARFFQSMGFDRKQWKVFATALREMALGATISNRVRSVHGDKYVLHGAIRTPCGRTPRVRAI